MADKKQKNAVGLLFLYRYKKVLVAILRVRGPHSVERKAPQFWRGGCQLSVHGKIETSEEQNPIEALWREVEQEVGLAIVPTLKTLYAEGKLIKLVDRGDPCDLMRIIAYGVVLKNQDDIDTVKSGMVNTEAASGDTYKLIGADEVDSIVDLKSYNKETGVTDPNIIAMFPLSKEAVQEAFKTFG